MLLVYYEQLCDLCRPQDVARMVKPRRLPRAEPAHVHYVNCYGKCIWKDRRTLEKALKWTVSEWIILRLNWTLGKQIVWREVAGTESETTLTAFTRGYESIMYGLKILQYLHRSFSVLFNYFISSFFLIHKKRPLHTECYEVQWWVVQFKMMKVLVVICQCYVEVTIVVRVYTSGTVGSLAFLSRH